MGPWGFPLAPLIFCCLCPITGFRPCYGWNSVPPKFILQSLNSQGDGIWRWGFGEKIILDEVMWMGPLRWKFLLLPISLLLSFLVTGWVGLQARKRALARTQWCWHPDCGLAASRTVSKNFSCLSHSVYSTIWLFCCGSPSRLRQTSRLESFQNSRPPSR